MVSGRRAAAAFLPVDAAAATSILVNLDFLHRWPLARHIQPYTNGQKD